MQQSRETMHTKQLYVNEDMKSSSDPTAYGTRSAVLRNKVAAEESADIYDTSAISATLLNKVRRKRERPIERSFLKLKTISEYNNSSW